MANRQVANAVIPSPDLPGSFLLLHRLTQSSDWWEFPGGKVDPGESPDDTAAREAVEELGVEIRIVRALGQVTLRGLNDTPIDCHWLQAEIINGSPSIHEPYHHVAYSYKGLSGPNSRSINLSESVGAFTTRFQNNGSNLENF